MSAPSNPHWLPESLSNLTVGPFSFATLLAAVLVVLLALLAAVVASRLARAVLLARGAQPGVAFAVGKVARYAVFLLGAAVALESFGFSVTAILTASSALLLGVGLGLQDIARNIIAGVLLLVERPVRKGDFVRVDDTYGVIDDIGLRATKILTRDEVLIIVPNNLLTSSKVVNLSVPTRTVRISVKVGVAYGTDTALVRRSLLAVAGAHETLLRTPEPEVRLEDFGDSSLVFALLVWIANPSEDLRVASDLRYAIDAAFRQAGIDIPFPQRVIHVAGAGRAAIGAQAS